MKKIMKICGYLGVAIWAIIAGYPFIFMILTSLKGRIEFVTTSIWGLPEQASLSNYISVLYQGFWKYILNSLIVVTAAVFIIIFVSTLASYVITRIDFRGSKVAFVIFILGMMIPIHSTLIPVYQIARAIGTYDKLIGMIGPYVAFMLPISIFILSGFMEAIPKEMEESAFIDGATYLQIYGYIILPLTKPAISTIAIYTFVNLWNQFIHALVLVSSPANWLLPLGLWKFQGIEGFNVPFVMTALTLSAIPLILLFVIMQERVVKGMVAGALKG